MDEAESVGLITATMTTKDVGKMSTLIRRLFQVKELIAKGTLRAVDQEVWKHLAPFTVARFR